MILMEVRINKYLSAAGFCSRREADRLVEAGRHHNHGSRIDQNRKIRGNRPYAGGRSDYRCRPRRRQSAYRG